MVNFDIRLRKEDLAYQLIKINDISIGKKPAGSAATGSHCSRVSGKPNLLHKISKFLKVREKNYERLYG